MDVEESLICIPSRPLNGRNAAQLRQPGPFQKECPPDQANASLALILSDVTEVMWRLPLAMPCCGQFHVLHDKIHRLAQLAIPSFMWTLSLDHLQLLRRGRCLSQPEYAAAAIETNRRSSPRTGTSPSVLLSLLNKAMVPWREGNADALPPDGQGHEQSSDAKGDASNRDEHV
jgi:hypothetical protein